MARTISSYGSPSLLPLDDPLQQLTDPQPVGSDAVHGRDGAVEHVVPAAERAGSLQGEDVERLLHHAQAGVVASRVEADGALGAGADVEARVAEHHLVADRDERGRERPGLGIGRAQQVVRQPLGGLGADAGQARDSASMRRTTGSTRAVTGAGTGLASQARDLQAAGHPAELGLRGRLGLVRAPR